MALENTASIKDIITSLQSMEGINAKADLASVVGSPATAEDTMATMVNHIQSAKNELASKTGQVNTEPLQSLVSNLVVGKKWVEVIVDSTSETSVWTGFNGSSETGITVCHIPLFLGDVPFVPSKIVAMPLDKTIGVFANYDLNSMLIRGTTTYNTIVSRPRSNLNSYSFNAVEENGVLKIPLSGESYSRGVPFVCYVYE